MLLAGDVGGTKTRLGLFQAEAGKLKLVVSTRYVSAEFPNVESIAKRFIEEQKKTVAEELTAACFGVPGPVIHGSVKVTNLPWSLHEKEIAAALSIPKVRLVNDLVSTAAGIPTLPPTSFEVLYPGKGAVDHSGTACVVAPGTGLGHALIGKDLSKTLYLASEGGHADFAPNDEVQFELWRYLHKKYGHASVERVLCGPGLVNIYSFLRDSKRAHEPADLTEALKQPDQAAVIAKNGMSKQHPICVQALDLFCEILGAHCSNIMLTYLAVGGVYLGGGIPPKIAPVLKGGHFMHGYLRKGKCLDKVEATPVLLITDDASSLYGAANLARDL